MDASGQPPELVCPSCPSSEMFPPLCPLFRLVGSVSPLCPKRIDAPCGEANLPVETRLVPTFSPPLLDLFAHPTSPQLSPLLFSTGLRVLSKVMLLGPFGLSTLFSVGLGCCPSNDPEVWLWWFRFALNTPWLCCFVCTVSAARRSSGRLLSPP